MSEPAAEASGQAPLPRAAKWRRSLRRTVIALAVIVGAVLAIRFVLILVAEHHLAEARANLPFKLVAPKELPSTWGPTPSEAENAAPLVSEASAAIERIFASEGELAEGKSEAEVKKAEELDKECQRLLVIWGLEDPDWYPDEAEGSAEDNQTTEATRTKIPPRDAARAREFLGRFDKVFKLRDEAVRRPHYRDSFDWSVLFWEQPTVRPWRLVELSELECAVEAEEGRWEKAYGIQRTLLSLAQRFDEEPMPHLVLSTVSCRERNMKHLASMVARHPPAKAMAGELQQLLATDAAGQARRAWVAEGIWDNSAFEGLEDGRLILSDVLHGDRNAASRDRKMSPAEERAWLWLLRPMVMENRAACLEAVGLSVKALSKRPRECVQELAALEEGSRNKSWVVRLGWRRGVRWPGYAVWFYADEITGKMMCVALEVAAYREANGRYPESLGALAGADKLPRDPFTGGSAGEERPFQYRVAPEGFMLWSVGPDGRDEGGKTAEEVGVELWQGGDIVLEVPPRPPAASGGAGEE